MNRRMEKQAEKPQEEPEEKPVETEQIKEIPKVEEKKVKPVYPVKHINVSAETNKSIRMKYKTKKFEN